MAMCDDMKTNIEKIQDLQFVIARQNDEMRQQAELIARQAVEIESLRSEREWISVADSLPASQKIVVGLSPDYDDSKAVRYSGGYWWECNGYRLRITHWQPLPAPPDAG